MGMTCKKHGRNGKDVQNFHYKASREDTTWEDNIKMDPREIV